LLDGAYEAGAYDRMLLCRNPRKLSVMLSISEASRISQGESEILGPAASDDLQQNSEGERWFPDSLID